MSEGIITIVTFMNPVQADFARSVLEMEGIGCWLIDEAMCNVAPAYVFAVGGVKLQVRNQTPCAPLPRFNAKKPSGKKAAPTKTPDTSHFGLTMKPVIFT